MKSVLVIGMGRFGRHFASKMSALGNEVMIVDKNAEVVERYASTVADAQIADCMNENVLSSLGVHHFDLCFVAIGDDFKSSLVITALLKEFDAKYVVAKAKSSIQADLLHRIGADEVIYPEREMAENLLSVIMPPTFLTISSLPKNTPFMKFPCVIPGSAKPLRSLISAENTDSILLPLKSVMSSTLCPDPIIVSPSTIMWL